MARKPPTLAQLREALAERSLAEERKFIYTSKAGGWWSIANYCLIAGRPPARFRPAVSNQATRRKYPPGQFGKLAAECTAETRKASRHEKGLVLFNAGHGRKACAVLRIFVDLAEAVREDEPVSWRGGRWLPSDTIYAATWSFIGAFAKDGQPLALIAANRRRIERGAA